MIGYFAVRKSFHCTLRPGGSEISFPSTKSAVAQASAVAQSPAMTLTEHGGRTTGFPVRGSMMWLANPPADGLNWR